MVKKILKFFAYLLFFIASLIYFIPKTSIYYFAEQQLKPLAIIVSSEDVRDSGFSLLIEDADISVKSIESAKISKVEIGVYLLYNSVSLNGIALSGMAENFVPINVESVEFTHSVFDPLSLHLSANGEFGEASGTFNILDNNLSINLKPSKLMKSKYKNTLRTLKKTENGEYEYVKSF